MLASLSDWRGKSNRPRSHQPGSVKFLQAIAGLEKTGDRLVKVPGYEP